MPEMKTLGKKTKRSFRRRNSSEVSDMYLKRTPSIEEDEVFKIKSGDERNDMAKEFMLFKKIRRWQREMKKMWNDFVLHLVLDTRLGGRNANANRKSLCEVEKDAMYSGVSEDLEVGNSNDNDNNNNNDVDKIKGRNSVEQIPYTGDKGQKDFFRVRATRQQKKIMAWILVSVLALFGTVGSYLGIIAPIMSYCPSCCSCGCNFACCGIQCCGSPASAVAAGINGDDSKNSGSALNDNSGQETRETSNSNGLKSTSSGDNNDIDAALKRAGEAAMKNGKSNDTAQIYS